MAVCSSSFLPNMEASSPVHLKSESRLQVEGTHPVKIAELWKRVFFTMHSIHCVDLEIIALHSRAECRKSYNSSHQNYRVHSAGCVF